MDRRNFLSLASADQPGWATPQRQSGGAFHVAHIWDSHWGYRGPDHPASATTSRKAVATINASAYPPVLTVFTSDLTHTTDDPMAQSPST